MLNGVNVVDTITTRQMPIAVVVTITIVSIIVCGLFILDWRNEIKYKKRTLSWSSSTPVISSMIRLVIIAMLIATTFKFLSMSKQFETTYKATIDRSVSFVEFNKKYEVIAQYDNGEYLIRELSE